MGIKASDAFPSRYLQTSRVKEKMIVATISHVEMETVGNGAEAKKKPVLYLEGEKPLVVNRTNWELIADAFGDDSDAWAGQKIKVYATRTQFQGKSMDGIRVTPISPKSLGADLNDEIPFTP